MRRLAEYLLIFLVCQLPALATEMVLIVQPAPLWLAIIRAATQPLQGFLNALVFLRQGVAGHEEALPSVPFLWARESELEVTVTEMSQGDEDGVRAEVHGEAALRERQEPWPEARGLSSMA